MGGLIRRAELFNKLATVQTLAEAYAVIQGMEEVDAAPVRHGRWKRAYLDHVAMGERPSIFYCSVCNQCISYPVNYCPHCGARMDVKDET